jgi:hypothetical protein
VADGKGEFEIQKKEVGLRRDVVVVVVMPLLMMLFTFSHSGLG